MKAFAYKTKEGQIIWFDRDNLNVLQLGEKSERVTELDLNVEFPKTRTNKIKEKIIEGLANLNFEENRYAVTYDYHELYEGRFLNLDAGKVGDVSAYIQGFHDAIDWLQSR